MKQKDKAKPKQKDKAKAVYLLAVDELANNKELVSSIWITPFLLQYLLLFHCILVLNYDAVQSI